MFLSLSKALSIVILKKHIEDSIRSAWVIWHSARLENSLREEMQTVG